MEDTDLEGDGVQNTAPLYTQQDIDKATKFNSRRLKLRVIHSLFIKIGRFFCCCFKARG